MEKDRSNSTQKDQNKRKRSFPVRYNPVLEKLFFEIVNKIRTDANLHLMLEQQPLPVEPLESSKTENNAGIDEIVSNLRGLRLKNTPNKQDNSIVHSVELISVCTKKAKDIAASVIKDLETVLKTYKYIDLKWSVYGSYINDLCTVHSDTIDLSCEYGENTPSAAKNLVLKFSKIFETHSLFRREEFYEDARVPIIKLLHATTDKKVNITFFNDLAIRNVSLTKLYLSLNQDLKILILYLKDLLMKYELHGKKKITTHVLFWLVVYFLQDKGLLPPVKDIRKSAVEKCYVSGWNCSIPDNFSYPVKNKPPVSTLLTDFFVFYKDFNFLKYVISPYHGRSFPFEEFDRNPHIPKEARDEKDLQNATRHERKHAFFRSGFNIQDPVVLDFNLTVPIRADVINLFQVFCHRFVNDNYLPTKLPSKINGYGNISPIDLVRYASFGVFLRDIPTPWWQEIGQCVRMCVRRMMETIFDFELSDIVVEQNITRIIRDKEGYSENTNTVLYFDYCSTENTWKNDHVLGIFFGGVKPIGKSLPCKKSSLYLICEIDREKKMVYVFVRSNDRLAKFLHLHFGRLMLFILLK